MPYSPLKIELIDTGTQNNVWGATTNTNLGTAIEQAIGGKADVTISSTNVTLTLTNTNAAQDARALYLDLTGTPGGTATLNVPAVQKAYIVRNATTGGFAVTVKVTGQTGVSVPNGATMHLYNNGTDVVNAVTNLPTGATVNGVAIGTGVGTVTSVNVSGGSTGLTTSGGPITSLGTITLGGTLAIANGGTGATAASSARTNLGLGTVATLNSVSLTSNVTGTLPAGNGGTGNAFFSVSGPASSVKTFTFPNANATIARTDTGQTFSGTQNFTNDIFISAFSSGAVRVGKGAFTGSFGQPNVVVGHNSLEANTTGRDNVAVGFFSLASNTTGEGNTVINNSALSFNTTGNYNTAIGYGSLQSNTTGSSNIAIGFYSLYANTTGSNNIALGDYALSTSTGIGGNIAIGQEALRYTSAGVDLNNIAIGIRALQANTNGGQNVSIGYETLYQNTTGGANTGCGTLVLSSNTTGAQNTAMGVFALYFNTTGSDNTGIGNLALFSNTTGNNNTAIGLEAGYGTGSGSQNTTGTNNTFIGYRAVGSSSSANNTITLGNSSIATLRCQVTTISSLSDARDKKEIQSLSTGLPLINALRPVSFLWNMRDGGKVDIPEIGFIAQELQEAQKVSGLKVPNLVYEENPQKLEAAPGTLIPILVKAVQELSAKCDALQAEIDSLKRNKSEV
jgi:hypothetical protein